LFHGNKKSAGVSLRLILLDVVVVKLLSRFRQLSALFKGTAVVMLAREILRFAQDDVA